MNRKGANEIKRFFTPTSRAIARICGCYVDTEKNKETELKEAFLSLPREEVFKHFTILRNALSGTVRKNLINMELPLHIEAEGGIYRSLTKLRDSQLKDDEVLEEFYGKAIANYDYDENYYIILIHCAYDIPAKTMDGVEMFDAFKYVYKFIQYTICPVKLTKAELSYNPLTDATEDHSRDWLMEAPDQGFLFPIFNDRNTDIRSPSCYSRNPEQVPEILVDELLGCVAPMSAKSQEETFQTIMEETLGENCDFEAVKTIRENLVELVEETKDEPIPLTPDKYQMKRLLETNGATPEKLEELEQWYTQVRDGPGTSFVTVSVANTKSPEIKTPDASIKVVPDRTYLVENRMIKG